MLAIIGGSGLTKLANLDLTRREFVRTPWGEPSGALIFGNIANHPVVFIARHGYGHTIPPHKVNYRANLWALWEAKATRVVSVASVGAIRPDIKPGDLLIPDQVIDYTHDRATTFHEGLDRPVVHIDFTEPYDEVLRQKLIAATVGAGESAHIGGTYGATQGPRLETRAEINRLARDGCDVVGMTGMPEASLARELELPYAAINVVANYAAGRADSQHKVEFDSIEAVLQGAMGRVRRVLEHLCVSC
ncbi:MAG: hypothetical protein RIR70_1925 [Pseudomonadota bacterium]|jgi:5'-methylthioadenosine phosphorylase